MKKIIGAVIFMMIGGGLTYYGLGHHIVKTDKGTVIVPKAEMEIADTWVDIREWEAADFEEHPKVVKALIDNGHGQVVKDKVGDVLKDWLGDLGSIFKKKSAE